MSGFLNGTGTLADMTGSAAALMIVYKAFPFRLVLFPF
jgi:hypothetical protein